MFYRLLITFAKSLDPNQAQLNVGPDVDPNYLALSVFLKAFFEKSIFEIKKLTDSKKKTLHNYPAFKDLTYLCRTELFIPFLKRLSLQL